MRSIDINCDMGESYGNYQIGNDREVFPYITSSNIACGFHGGDAMHMTQTIELAKQHDVQIGAHPSFPDRAGFGRRYMELPADELKAVIKYQLAAIRGMAESLEVKVKYVKPHGALYNLAAKDIETSKILIQAIQEVDRGMAVMGLSASSLEEACKSIGVHFVAEAFADRVYESNGALRSRKYADSLITDPERAVDQVLSIILEGQVTGHDGGKVEVQAQTICVHGDNPSAIEILKAVDIALQQNNISKQSFS